LEVPFEILYGVLVCHTSMMGYDCSKRGIGEKQTCAYSISGYLLCWMLFVHNLAVVCGKASKTMCNGYDYSAAAAGRFLCRANTEEQVAQHSRGHYAVAECRRHKAFSLRQNGTY
jgi:hypothetical protein